VTLLHHCILMTNEGQDRLIVTEIMTDPTSVADTAGLPETYRSEISGGGQS